MHNLFVTSATCYFNIFFTTNRLLLNASTFLYKLDDAYLKTKIILL